MTQLEELLAIPGEPIYPSNALRLIIRSIIIKLNEQRLYSTITCENIEEIIERFVTSHAESDIKNPTAFVARLPHRILAVGPLKALYWTNGVVFRLTVDEPQDAFSSHLFFWINESTASRWAYPDHLGWFFSKTDAFAFRQLMDKFLIGIDISDQYAAHETDRQNQRIDINNEKDFHDN